MLRHAWAQEQFENIIRNHGHTAFLRRRKSAKATGPFMKVADGKYEQELEAWTIWRSLRRGKSITSSNTAMFESDGIISENSGVFYCQSSCSPKTSDLWIEETPNERVKYETWIIKRVVPYYLDNSVVYFACMCDRVEPVS